MVVNTKFNIGDTVRLNDDILVVCGIEYIQYYKDTPGSIYYMVTNKQPIEIKKWVNEDKLETYGVNDNQQ